MYTICDGLWRIRRSLPRLYRRLSSRRSSAFRENRKCGLQVPFEYDRKLINSFSDGCSKTWFDAMVIILLFRHAIGFRAEYFKNTINLMCAFGKKTIPYYCFSRQRRISICLRAIILDAGFVSNFMNSEGIRRYLTRSRRAQTFVRIYSEHKFIDSLDLNLLWDGTLKKKNEKNSYIFQLIA